MLTEYPAVGFHFLVTFDIFPQLPYDMRFQSVSGLTVEVETESFKEGGENRFVHKLPVRTKYTDITLQRGIFTGSGLVLWCRQAIEDYNFQPANLLITLLNDMHLPVSAWYVVGAYPISWSVSDFKAEENSIAVETLKLNYKYFKTYRI